MTEALPLGELVVLLALAVAGAALFERLRLPAIAGYLVAGALVGPGGLGLVADLEGVRRVAEIGVVFLLFEIGLELPLERLRSMGRSLVVGAIQVSVTLAATAGLAVSLGVGGRTALLLGALVAMSSTALVIRLLTERGEVDAPHGQLAIAILLFQDLCIVPFLLAVPLLASPEPLSAMPILGAFARAGLAGAAVYAIARFALPRILSMAANLRSRDIFSLVAVLVVAGAAVGAEELGLGLAVGAFLAGLAVSTSPWGHQLFAEVLPLRGVLLGIFFTAVGTLLDLGSALDAPLAVASLFLASTVLKALVVGVGALVVLGLGVRASLFSALSLAQTGEFSFVLAGAAAAAGLLDSGLEQAFVAASVMSLVATPFLMRLGPFLLDRGEASAPSPAKGADELEGHVVLVGFGLTGRNLARVLDAVQVPWRAVDLNPSAAREARARSEGRVIFGDATRVGLMEQLGVARARVVVVAVTDPLATRRIVTLVKRLNPEASLLARTRFAHDIDTLQTLGASEVVAEELEAGIDLVTRVLRGLGRPSGAIESFVEELRAEGYAQLQMPPGLALDPWLAELLEHVATEWVEVPETFASAPIGGLSLRAHTGVNVLAVERGDLNTPNPGPEFMLQAGDRLLVLGGSDSIVRLRSLLAGEGAVG
jgi:CPA2 family monovalent cation:H+ antiporter-2